MTTENKLPKEEMRTQAKAQVEELMARLTEKAIGNIDAALSCGACPDEWSQKDDYRLAKAVIDSVCVDRPLKPFDKQNQKDFANLHLFL